MKHFILLLLYLFCGLGTFQIVEAQNYKMPVLEGKYEYPDGKGYIEFSGDRYGYGQYVREEYDGRIYFGTYFLLPEINYNQPYANTGNGTLTITWWCGSTVETTISGVGSRSIRISVNHLGNAQQVRLSRVGNCTLTNQDVVSQQNGSHPTYYNQKKPPTSGTGMGASYAGTWKRTDGRATLELSAQGVMRFTVDGKMRYGKFDYLSPYSALGDRYGSIFFYWHDGKEEKCFVTRLTNSRLTIDDSQSTNEYIYEDPKAITKEEADKLSLGEKTDKPKDASGGVPPLKSDKSLVGKWEALSGGEILEFSDDTYFRTSSKSSTDKNYGTYTREWNTGSVRLHFYGQDIPVSIAIRSITAKELILETSTSLPSRYKFMGITALNRKAVRAALSNDLDGQGGEGERLWASPTICYTCSGSGSKKCGRCYGDGTIEDIYLEYDYNQGRDVQKTRRITCPQCSGDECEECDDYTCIRRRSISPHSEYILRPAMNPCRKFGSGQKYYLIPNGEGGNKIIWE